MYLKTKLSFKNLKRQKQKLLEVCVVHLSHATKKKLCIALYKNKKMLMTHLFEEN